MAPETGLCDELHLAPEGDGDHLADDDAQAPGRQDRVQRAGVERPHDGALDHQAQQEADQLRRREWPARGSRPSCVMT